MAGTSKVMQLQMPRAAPSAAGGRGVRGHVGPGAMHRRPAPVRRHRPPLAVIGGVLAVAVMLVALAAAFLARGAPTRVATDSSRARGSPSAPVQMELWSDFQ